MKIYTDYKNLKCESFNTYIVLKWRTIIEEYGTYIEYTKEEKNIVADALPIFPSNGNQENTQESTYKKEIASEIN